MSIIKIAKQYNEFQNNFGQRANMNYSELINNSFSSDFKKIANGSTLVNSRDELENQLNGVREVAGNWKINETYIIPSEDGKQCTFRYLIKSDKAGTFDVIAVMESNDGVLIDNIDEIYYQM